MPAAVERVRPTWPVYATPTPAQFVDWFLSCPREQQEDIADRAIQDSAGMAECYIRHGRV